MEGLAPCSLAKDRAMMETLGSAETWLSRAKCRVQRKASEAAFSFGATVRSGGGADPDQVSKRVRRAVVYLRSA